MSITRSYNKHTNTFYAYETTYEWSEEKQKKVQRKKCIGKYDPVTDEIIPNGKRGRPVKEVEQHSDLVMEDSSATIRQEQALEMVNTLAKKLDSIEELINQTVNDIRELRRYINDVSKKLENKE